MFAYKCNLIISIIKLWLDLIDISIIYKYDRNLNQNISESKLNR